MIELKMTFGAEREEVTRTFPTDAEADAYIRGCWDAYGWDVWAEISRKEIYGLHTGDVSLTS